MNKYSSKRGSGHVDIKRREYHQHKGPEEEMAVSQRAPWIECLAGKKTGTGKVTRATDIWSPPGCYRNFIFYHEEGDFNLSFQEMSHMLEVLMRSFY